MNHLRFVLGKTGWSQITLSSNSPISTPLITANNNPLAFGFINEPGTRIIFGAGSPNNTFDLGGIQGGRLTLAAWIDEANRYGLEGIFFGLEKKHSSFSASSAAGVVPILNIPFFSTETSVERVFY
jgi:hypothetical protein